jgi:hypothetical protein
MTIAEALAYAHTHQPAIHAALSRIAERMAQATIPSGRWLPTVAVTAQLYGMTANNTTGSYLSTEFMDVPRIGGTASQSQSTASLSPYPATLVGAGLLQEVFDFGRIGAQRAAADDLVTVEKRRSEVVRLDIDFGVEEAYFSVLAAKSIILASDEAYERSRVHRDLAKRGVDSGLRSPIELTRAEADLARFDVGRIKARGGLALAQNVFAASRRSIRRETPPGWPTCRRWPRRSRWSKGGILSWRRPSHSSKRRSSGRAPSGPSFARTCPSRRPSPGAPAGRRPARRRSRLPVGEGGCPTSRTGMPGSCSRGHSSTGPSRRGETRPRPPSKCAATRSTWPESKRWRG